uniref:Zinc finger, CCHC-type n=1 Tax=Tanacetum cinerariifolium TaxID=118510 RepID=A0A6L2JKJ1_TANCI|nr:zinc finger, CCHC-type [Tanacetum cinerariifolium]
MATQVGSTTTGVGSSSSPTIAQILTTTQNPEVWQHYNLCKRTDNSTKAQCKHCFNFFSSGSNSTLRNHITHPHCKAFKMVPKARQSSMARDESVILYNLDVLHKQFAGLAQKNQNPEAGQTSMARDGSVFRYDLEYLREQFAGLVIQRALSFNHFDHAQTTRVFQNTMQPRYTHWEIRRTRLTPTSLEICMCLNDHLDAKERKQNKCPLEIPLDFEEDVFDDELQRNEAIPLFDEEIALDASSKCTMSSGGPRTAELQNDILRFQQHQDKSHYDAWTRFKDLLLKVPHHGIDLWLQVQIFYDHVDSATQMAINYAAGGRLRKLRPEEAWETFKELAQYKNEGWNDPIFLEEGSLDDKTPTLNNY